MIIDGHAHSCGIFQKPENIIRVLNELNVDKVIICPAPINNDKNVIVPNLARLFKNADLMFFFNPIIRLVTNLSKITSKLDEANQYVFEISKAYPEHIIQFYWINPKDKNVLDKVAEDYIKMNFKGIKVHQCFQVFQANSKIMYSLSEFAAKNNIPFFLHLLSKKEVYNFIKLAKDNPDTYFIIAHLIGLEIFISENIDIPNIYFDISPTPLVSNKRVLKAISYFGSEHIILGSDTPYGKNNLSKNIQRIKNLQLPKLDKKNILGENIKKLLKLETSPTS